MLLRIPHEIREDDLHTTTIRCGETRAIGIIDVLQAHTLICGNTTLLFAKDENVLFTHNRAERDLHMSQVKQKTSGCFRNPNTPKSTAPSQVTNQAWLSATTTRSSPFSWPFPGSHMLNHVRCY